MVGRDEGTASEDESNLLQVTAVKTQTYNSSLDATRSRSAVNFRM